MPKLSPWFDWPTKLAEELDGQVPSERAHGYDEFADLLERAAAALRAAEQDRKDAERFRLCIEHGWPSFHPPKQPTTSFKDPSKLIGKHEPSFWAMSTPWGLFYGDTALAAIDSALSENEEKPHG